MAERVHVVGAGLAGLAAAVALVARGRSVALYEQAGQAGGRCRSFHDEVLDRSLDNGNHLVLTGNRAIYTYLREIDAVDRLSGPERAAFPFVDIGTGERWTVRPGAGRLPWWILSQQRRVPGTRLRDYLSAWRLARARKEQTVASCLDTDSDLYRRFWEPLTVAALNTRPEEAAARLLWPVLRETFGRGEKACRPRIARRGLTDCFIDPAVRYLRRHGADVYFRMRLRGVDTGAERVRRLRWAGGDTLEVAAGEQVVLAVPPSAATALLPGLTVPGESRAIVNAHFRLPQAVQGPDFVGLIGGLSQWIFVRDDVASVTVSAANGLAEDSNEAIAARLWPEVRQTLQVADPTLPPWRVLKEKRATFAQTPAQVSLRPGCRTAFTNLFLAGDWTDTGLPATLEGSVRSGNTAAATVLADAAKS